MRIGLSYAINHDQTRITGETQDDVPVTKLEHNKIMIMMLIEKQWNDNGPKRRGAPRR